MGKESVTYFCPTCGSPSVEYSALAVGTANCKACDWFGKQTELAAYTFEHDFGSDEDALIQMSNEMRKIYLQMAPEFAKLLAKWGFIYAQEAEKQKAQLMRYLSSLARAGLEAVVAERQSLEVERVRPRS